MNRRRLIMVALILSGLPAACVTPDYVDKSKKSSGVSTGFNDVVFEVHAEYTASPPSCVAVMPLDGPEKGKALDPAQLEAVRRAVYAHLAPQGRRVEKPARVDFILDRLEPSERGNLAVVGQRLGCDALITGRVTEFGSHYYGIYSRVGVGADLKMVRAADGIVLWEGHHVASIRGGTVPITPIGLAEGMVDAATNVEDEQTFRVVDDVARRLVGTIPDNAIVALDDPAAPVAPAASSATEPLQPVQQAGYETFLSSLADLPPEEKRTLLVTAVDNHAFGPAGQAPLLDALVSANPPRAEDEVRYANYLAETGDYGGALTHAEVAVVVDGGNAPAQFIQGRMLIKLGKLDRAEAPILEAVALDGRNTAYLNALGYVNSLKNNTDRSLAAYRLAFEADHGDGYALYNTGVLLYNKGDDRGAADAFYGAGLAYLKAKNYGQAGKALANLRELAGHGPVPSSHIDMLQSAIETLGKKGDQS